MATTKLSSFHLEQVVLELLPLEDIALEFINHTTLDMDEGSAQAFRNKCDNFIKEGQLQDLVDAFLDGLVLVGKKASVENTIPRFSILFSFARHLPPDVLSTVVPRIAKVVKSLPACASGESEKDNDMRLSVLRYLYTMLDPKSPTRYSTLVSMLEFASAQNLFGVLDGTSAVDIEELCNLWNSDSDAAQEEKKSLYKMFCDLAEKKRQSVGKDSAEEVRRTDELKEHRFLVKLLELYETSPEQLSSVSSYAARASLISIKYPLPGDMAVSNSLEEQSLEGLGRAAVAILTAEHTQKVDTSIAASPSTMAHFAAVKFLSSVPEHSTVYKLLHIFAAQGLEEYNAFVKAQPNAIAELGLNPDSCLRNIRFLTLASLAAKNESVTYSTIAKHLQVDESEVERWVIEGITNKVIDAKMDQLNQSIVINRGSQRLLTEAQWEEVQAKLSQWKSSVRNLLGTIKSVRQEQEMLQQPQQ